MKAALQAPAKFHNSMPEDASYPIIWDSGTSVSITFRPEDFIDEVTYQPNLKIKDLSNKMAVHGKGTVLWTVLDFHGTLRTFKLPALLVPKSKARIWVMPVSSREGNIAKRPLSYSLQVTRHLYWPSLWIAGMCGLTWARPLSRRNCLK